MFQRWMNLQAMVLLVCLSRDTTSPPHVAIAPDQDLDLTWSWPWTPFDLTGLGLGLGLGLDSFLSLYPCSICSALRCSAPAVHLTHSFSLLIFPDKHISRPQHCPTARPSSLPHHLTGFFVLTRREPKLGLRGLACTRSRPGLFDFALLILGPQHAIRSTGFYMLSLL